MKKISTTVLFWLMCPGVFAASEQVPINRTIDSINTYGNIAFLRFTPAFENTQGCVTTDKNVFEISFDSNKGKEMYSAALVAAAGNKQVGFGLGGCSSSGNPVIYRIDVKF